jgi:hypothetical protein
MFVFQVPSKPVSERAAAGNSSVGIRSLMASYLYLSRTIFLTCSAVIGFSAVPRVLAERLVDERWSHWLALARVAPFFTQKSHAPLGRPHNILISND